ncbi:MAG: bifunctional 2-C-methyl-D-erythritol 4-phosphate cytidylyltransferase/2-C-methyl-D-erythritol 2,4-cyclodiphosphate synthase [Magnetococcus sp. YQC-9]
MIVVAAGQGSRFGAGLPKQYLPLAGQPLLAHAIERLHAHPLVEAILPVIAPDGRELWDDHLGPRLADWPKLMPPVPGGAERQDSVRLGLQSLNLPRTGWVGIHDGARPFPSRELLDRLFAARAGAEAVVPAIIIHDTIKRIDATGRVGKTLDRSNLRRIQTPQVFRYGPLLAGHLRAHEAGVLRFTDDAALMEAAYIGVQTIAGEEENLKITRPEDLILAEKHLSIRSSPMENRIGQGFDVHRFAPERPLILGGVTIPHEQGLLGHSDADVLLHAIIDALLGAASLGDIGHHFPDSDPAYRGADSRELLRRVHEAVNQKGYGVVNLDATLICQAPRIAPHIKAMRANIAATLTLDPERINIKATTTEKLGFTGRGEGIAAQAVALLARAY